MSNLSNYPPGVTGNEYAISGAQHEWEEERECPHCGWEGLMAHEAHYEFGVMAWCGNPELVEPFYDGTKFDVAHCPLTTEGFIVDLEPDPDAAYDRMRDDRRDLNG